ncbi:MAG: CAP domain-containing protein [Chloroflexota bacterium]
MPRLATLTVAVILLGIVGMRADSDLAVQATTLPVEYEAEVVRLVNGERVARGLWPLAVSDSLSAAARAHTADMIANNFFLHTGSDGSMPWSRAEVAGFQPYGWGDCFVGEDIAVGSRTPADVVNLWMGSDAHRDIILDADYRETGVGYGESAPSVYWTIVFGSQPLVLPVFVNNGAVEAFSPAVTLTLTDETVSSWGSIGPVTQVMLANDEGFAGGSWRDYTQNTAWSLPDGDGVRTVYVRLKDADGHEVQSAATVYVRVLDLPNKVYLPLVIRQ